MKILHILDHSLPLHSGYTFRSANIFREQRRRGWEPLVVTSPKHEASWKGPWLPEEEWIGVRYYRSGAVPPSAVPGLSEGRLMMRLERRLRQVIARENPVLVHAHSPVLNAIPALWAARRAGGAPSCTKSGPSGKTRRWTTAPPGRGLCDTGR